MHKQGAPEVLVDDPGSLNLLGLVLRQLINQNLKKPKLVQKLPGMHVVMGLRAGRMCVTLRVKDGTVSLENGSAPDVNIRVRGSMKDFMTLGLSKVPWEGLLRGRLWASGRIYKLPGVISLLVA